MNPQALSPLFWSAADLLRGDFKPREYGRVILPFGLGWKKIERAIRQEYETKGYSGRFGPGLPRVSDGPPLCTGGAGSGESELRRHVRENERIETIVALPIDMLPNTGFSACV